VAHSPFDVQISPLGSTMTPEQHERVVEAVHEALRVAVA